jgi:hypothetical protein
MSILETGDSFKVEPRTYKLKNFLKKLWHGDVKPFRFYIVSLLLSMMTFTPLGFFMLFKYGQKEIFVPLDIIRVLYIFIVLSTDIFISVCLWRSAVHAKYRLARTFYEVSCLLMWFGTIIYIFLVIFGLFTLL